MDFDKTRLRKLRTKIFFLLITSLVLINGCVSSTSKSLPEIKISDILGKVFTLHFLYTWGIISEPINPLEGLIRFFLLITLFVVLFKLGESAGLHTSIRVVLSLLLSFMTVIFIPSAVIIAAATTYSLIISLLILGLPLAIGILAYLLVKQQAWLKTLVCFLTAFIVWHMDIVLKVYGEKTTGSIAKAFKGLSSGFWSTELVFWILIILGIVSLIQAIGGMRNKVGETTRGVLGDLAGKVGEKIKTEVKKLGTDSIKLEKKAIGEWKWLKSLEKVLNNLSTKKPFPSDFESYEEGSQKIADILRKELRGERRLNQRFKKVEKEAERYLEDLRKADLDKEAEKIKNILEELRIYNKEIIRTMARGGTFEETFNQLNETIKKYKTARKKEQKLNIANTINQKISALKEILATALENEEAFLAMVRKLKKI